MKGPRQLHIFVLIDALGWSLIENNSFLREVLPHRQGLRTQLGFSSGVIPSILTGLSPAQNGIWNLVYYDPERSPFRWMRRLSFLPQDLLDNRLGRRFMTELGRRALGLGPGFDCCVSPKLLPWFNWTEQRNIYERGGLGATPSIFDELAGQEIPYRVYSYQHATDRQILAKATTDVARNQAGFFFLYLCELDSFLHMHCNDPEKIAGKLSWYEQSLQRLFEAALRRDREAKFFLFSDHGMTPVRRHYDLAADIGACGLRMPQDYLAVYDSTMARFWFFSGQARVAITDYLRRVPCGRLLPDDELRQLGVFFPDNRYGETILLMEPGTLIANSGFNGSGGWKPAGMHGYHPDDPHSDAVFLTNHEPATPPSTVRDVYRYMRESVS
jgi:predicted AlkP superfamily pyrophosphatase or phosphodiesterase